MEMLESVLRRDSTEQVKHAREEMERKHKKKVEEINRDHEKAMQVSKGGRRLGRERWGEGRGIPPSLSPPPPFLPPSCSILPLPPTSPRGRNGEEGRGEGGRNGG